MPLTIPKQVDWCGYYVALDEMTYEKEVGICGISGKDPISNHESGGCLFQGAIKFYKCVTVTKTNFMAENVLMFNERLELFGNVGVMKNCHKIDNLYCLTYNSEMRFIRINIVDEFIITKSLGEMIEVAVKKKPTIITNSGFILRDSWFMGGLIVDNVYIDGSKISTIDEQEETVRDIAIGNSFLRINDMTSRNLLFSNVDSLGFNFNMAAAFYASNSSILGSRVNALGVSLSTSDIFGSKFNTGVLSLSESNLFGSKFDIAGDPEDPEAPALSLEDSAADIMSLQTEKVNLVSSSLVTKKSISTETRVSRSSSFVGLKTEGNVSSSGSVLLTSSVGSVTVSDQGFIGIGVYGKSNFSSLQKGVDILAVPRINNRTRNDFIAQAYENIFLYSGGNLLAHADNTTCVTASSNLLCEAGGTMNLCAGNTQLLKGQKVYVVGAATPNFFPADHCTSSDCRKPVWIEKTTGKTISPPTLPG